MGRHSAPADDEVTAVAASAPVDADPDADIVGRHSRPAPHRTQVARRPPVLPRPRAAATTATTGPVARIPTELPAELPAERTLAIAAVDAELAADADAGETPVLDASAVAALEPIRPGEAVSPPPADDLHGLRRPSPKVAPVDDETDTSSEERTAGPAAEHTTPSEQSDLALLRSNPSLRARCLAGLAAPFVVYVVVMVVIGGHGRQWLIWIWIPTIAAGVLVGAMLDLAHKRLGGATAEQSEVSGS